MKRSLFKVSSKVSEALNPSRRNNKLIITMDYEFKGATNRSRLLETYTRYKRLALAPPCKNISVPTWRQSARQRCVPVFLRNGEKGKFRLEASGIAIRTLLALDIFNFYLFQKCQKDILIIIGFVRAIYYLLFFFSNHFCQ